MSRSLATESLLARYPVPVTVCTTVRFGFGCSASGSGGTELVTLDNHGMNLARQELALVSQPPVPLRQKHARIGSSVGIKSEAAELC